MRRIWIAVFVLLVQTAYALPVGNPSEASLFCHRNLCAEPCQEEPCAPRIWDYLGFGVGFYGDYVFNHHMKTDSQRKKDIDTIRLFTNAAYLVANICDRVDVFSSLGATRLSLNTSLGAFNPSDPHPLFELETQTSFSYSIGARATLIQYRCFSLGFEGQYFATSPNVKRLYIAAGAVSYPGEALRTRYSEWQVGAGISYRYNCFFVPYAAVKYGHSFWKLNDGGLFIIETNNGTFLFNLKNKRSWGYAIGLTLCPEVCKRLAVTAEARFGNEKALYVNAHVRF